MNNGSRAEIDVRPLLSQRSHSACLSSSPRLINNVKYFDNIKEDERERKNDRVSNPSTHTHTVVSECWKKKVKTEKKQREQQSPTAGWENKRSQILTRGEKIKKKKKTSWSLKEKKKLGTRWADRLTAPRYIPNMPVRIFYSRESLFDCWYCFFLFFIFELIYGRNQKNEKMCVVFSQPERERNREIDSRKYIYFPLSKKKAFSLLSLASHQPVKLGPLRV